MNGRELTVGNLVPAIGELVRPNALLVAIYILMIGAVNEGAAYVSESVAGEYSDNFRVLLLASIASTVAYVLITALPTYALSLSFLRSVGLQRDGRHPLSAFLKASLIASFGIVVGLFFFIIPGLIFMVRWSAATGFLIIERKLPTDALGSSWDATRGWGWHIFAVMIFIFSPTYVAEFALTMASAQDMLELGSWSSILANMLHAISSAFVVALGIVVYDIAVETDTRSAEVFK